MLDKLSEFNEKWKVAVNIGYVKLGYIAYAGYELSVIVLIFECAQNIEIGMSRYTAFVSQIAGIAPFIRVKEYWVGGRCRKVTLE